MHADGSPLPLHRSTRFLGQDVFRMAIGSWRWPTTPEASIRACLTSALGNNICVLDTAAIYGWGSGTDGINGFGLVESRLGAILSSIGADAERFLVVTKGGIIPPSPYESTKAHLIASCEGSLQRLGREVIDLFLIHRPDNLASHGEVAGALEALLNSGKVKHVGVSNYTVEQTRALQSMMSVPLMATQPEISAYAIATLEDGLLDQAQAMALTPMAWSALAGGALATCTSEALDQQKLGRVVAALDSVAKKNETTRDLVAYAWLLAHPSGIMPILGTSSPERVENSVRAFDIKMSREDWYSIFSASRGAPMP